MSSHTLGTRKPAELCELKEYVIFIRNSGKLHQIERVDI